MKNKRIILAISGKKGSGKDLFYEILNKKLIERSHPVLVKLKFAEPLKQICSVLTDLPLQYFYDHSYYGNTTSINNLTIRELQQQIGTEVFRGFHNNIWIECLKNKLANSYKDFNICITDLRFKDEFETLKNMSDENTTCILVRINIDKMHSSDEQSKHISETDLDNIDINRWDYVFYNDKKNISLLEKHCDQILYNYFNYVLEDCKNNKL